MPCIASSSASSPARHARRSRAAIRLLVKLQRDGQEWKTRWAPRAVESTRLEGSWSQGPRANTSAFILFRVVAKILQGSGSNQQNRFRIYLDRTGVMRCRGTANLPRRLLVGRSTSIRAKSGLFDLSATDRSRSFSNSEHSVGVTETAEVVRQALDNADRTESKGGQRPHDA